MCSIHSDNISRIVEHISHYRHILWFSLEIKQVACRIFVLNRTAAADTGIIIGPVFLLAIWANLYILGGYQLLQIPLAIPAHHGRPLDDLLAVRTAPELSFTLDGF